MPRAQDDLAALCLSSSYDAILRSVAAIALTNVAPLSAALRDRLESLFRLVLQTRSNLLSVRYK